MTFAWHGLPARVMPAWLFRDLLGVPCKCNDPNHLQVHVIELIMKAVPDLRTILSLQ